MILVTVILLALLLVLLPPKHREAFARRLLPGRESPSGAAQWVFVVLAAGVLLALAMNPEARLLLVAIDAVGLDMFVLLLVLQLRYGMNAAKVRIKPVVQTLHSASWALARNPRLVAPYVFLVVSLGTPFAWIAAT